MTTKQRTATTISREDAERDWVPVFAGALALLDNLTTDEYARGGDRPVRAALARYLANAGAELEDPAEYLDDDLPGADHR